MPFISEHYKQRVAKALVMLLATGFVYLILEGVYLFISGSSLITGLFSLPNFAIIFVIIAISNTIYVEQTKKSEDEFLRRLVMFCSCLVHLVGQSAYPGAGFTHFCRVLGFTCHLRLALFVGGVLGMSEILVDMAALVVETTDSNSEDNTSQTNEPGWSKFLSSIYGFIVGLVDGFEFSSSILPVRSNISEKTCSVAAITFFTWVVERQCAETYLKKSVDPGGAGSDPKRQ